jgi:hypothetical protein
MTVSYLATLLLVGTASAAQPTPAACAREVNATATAFRLSELPPAIRSDLARLVRNEMADSGSVILQTDAPSKAETRLPRARFLQAMLVNHTWYVSFEISMMAPYTLGYARMGSERSELTRVHSVSFTGPPCEAVKAALNRVGTFDSNIFDH